MKKFFRDFKAFVTRGNVVDLAVAVIIGAAFGKIITSLVNDVIMPLISLLVGGVSVADWKWVISEAVYENGILVAAENALHYGAFLQTIIDFLIISFFVFLVIKLLMQAQKGFAHLGEEIGASKRKEKKTLMQQGYTAKEAKRIIGAKAEAAAIEAKRIEAEKKEEEKKNSTEALLKEIRDLLKDKTV